MTYKMGKVISMLERMPSWVQNVITFSDIQEIANDFEVATTEEIIHDALLRAARKRRDNS